MRWMSHSRKCGRSITFEDREDLAQNINNTVKNDTQSVMTHEFKVGLCGWNLPNARRMGIQEWWTSDFGIQQRVAQCQRNVDQAADDATERCGVKENCSNCASSED